MAVSMYFRDKDGNTIDIPVLQGPAGGHYTPVVSQPDSETMQVDFAASHAGMPAVEPAQVKLPGAGSGQNVPHIGNNGNWWIGDTDTGTKARGIDGNDYILTDADKTEIAELAAELVDTALLDTIGTGEVTV